MMVAGIEASEIWNDMSTFDVTIKPIETPKKASQPWRNVANNIEIHLRNLWPELVTINGLWFTGSQVWSHLYNNIMSNTIKDSEVLRRDMDIYCNTEEIFDKVYVLLNSFGGYTLSTKHFNAASISSDNVIAVFTTGAKIDVRERGKVDIWYSHNNMSITDMLRAYPPNSHSHCRAAFSFENGLIVLPNEKTGEYER